MEAIRKKDIDKLKRIQQRATKMITKLRNLNYESCLLECGLPPSEKTRLRGNQIEPRFTVTSMIRSPRNYGHPGTVPNYVHSKL